MGEFFFIKETVKSENRFNAGSKARQDADRILLSMGGHPVEVDISFMEDRTASGRSKKIYYHYIAYKAWKKAVRHIPGNSILILQFPVISHTVFLRSLISQLKKKGIRVIAVIHDLEALRNSIFFDNDSQGLRLRMEETWVLKLIDILIVHNDRMKEILCDRFGIEADKMISLEIFDYLISTDPAARDRGSYKRNNSVMIAANLDQNKSGYLYKLPQNPQFELYGANYRGNSTGNIHYNGVFPPDELPFNLSGDFGLVWDGDSIDSCEGFSGKYLLYNDPHKCSLYLACGIPVIIWEKAALASFIRDNDCGITVDSLETLSDRLNEIPDERYSAMRANAEKTGEKLREGGYLKKAVEAAFGQVWRTSM